MLTVLLPVIFNSTPADEPIQLITNTNDASHLTDAKQLSVEPHYGPMGTFNGFRSKEQNDEPIGYIFIKKNIWVLQHATLSQTREGRFSPDHFPVYAVLPLN